MYVVTKLPNTNKENKGEKRKKKEKEIHTGFVGMGGR